METAIKVGAWLFFVAFIMGGGEFIEYMGWLSAEKGSLYLLVGACATHWASRGVGS